MNEKERLKIYITEFKKAYLKGKLSLEDSHAYELTFVYNKIKNE